MEYFPKNLTLQADAQPSIFVCLAVIVLALVTTFCCRQFQWILGKGCCGSCVEAYQEHRMVYYDLTPRDLENMVP